MKKRNALISVYHKDGITQFAKELIDLGFTIYASGGTAKHLKEANVEAIDVAVLVGGSAILGHRVVTLSRQIHAGLLSRDTEVDMKELSSLNIPHLDLVCVDLYPLEAEISKEDSTKDSVVSQTDIGGPCMIRSGVKGNRIVICDPKDRSTVIDWLKNGEQDISFREYLGAKGEFVVSKYCMTSANYLSNGNYEGIFGEKIATCRYGENAYQTPAGLFSSHSNDPLSLENFKVLEGTPPSYNNYCDIDRMLQTITHIAATFSINKGSVPLIAIGAKHGNACGSAIGNSKAEVIKKMMAGDPLSIFGGLIMTNFSINEEEAEALSGKMLDGIIAPDFSKEAIDKLRRKGDKCRFIKNTSLGSLDEKSIDAAPRFRYVRGGFLKQPNYTFITDLKTADLQKFGTPSEQTKEDMLLAGAIGSVSNSNTITLVKNGIGQQDRVGAAKLAIERAIRSGHDICGAAAYSDSFFPFPDGPQVLIEAGVSAILTTSGSVRDKETISLCEEKNIVLYMIPDSLGRGFFGH